MFSTVRFSDRSSAGSRSGRGLLRMFTPTSFSIARECLEIVDAESNSRRSCLCNHSGYVIRSFLVSSFSSSAVIRLG